MPAHMSSIQQLGIAALALATVLWTVVLIRALRREPDPGTVAPRADTTEPLAAPEASIPDATTPDAVTPPDRETWPRPAGLPRPQQRRPRAPHARSARATLRAMPHQHIPTTESVALTVAERAAFAALVRQFDDDHPRHP
ncbi:hypothetical protein GT204_23600 [Streptomyces sp. SID4919]|nr:hypothetical protein [Streptomyces sp. SID4919]SCK12003.1 hypothetical protein YW7DRAFT_00687 [Streptomyces sp. AmelKG-E11A]